MNRVKQLLILGGLAVVISGQTPAADNPASTTGSTAQAKPQTHCPVMGGEIDSTAYTDIQGHRVYHCCPSCTKNLRANPDKYFEKAAAEGIIFENIQTTDPVSGEKLVEKKIYMDYRGRRIYFASEANKARFTSAPSEYLKKMDTPAGDVKPTRDTNSAQDHSQGHGDR